MMFTLEVRLSRLVNKKTLKNFKIVHDENRMANVIRFSIETIQGMEL